MTDGKEKPAAIMPQQTATITSPQAKPDGAIAPAEFIAQQIEYARVIRDVITKAHLSKPIQGREYVFCEGWTTLARMVGYIASIKAVEELRNGQNALIGFKAVATLSEIRTGRVVCEAEARCYREGQWAKREFFAICSMAQTRAIAKVCRVALSFVMTLAGYAPTPVEEMDFAEVHDAGATEIPQPQETVVEKPKPKTNLLGKCYAAIRSMATKPDDPLCNDELQKKVLSVFWQKNWNKDYHDATTSEVNAFLAAVRAAKDINRENGELIPNPLNEPPF